jgi:MFS family permease
MARFDGQQQGIAVWGWSVVIPLLGVILALASGRNFGTQSVFGGMTVATAGLVVALFVLTLIGAVLGGRLGERFHRRVDSAGVPDTAHHHHSPRLTSGPTQQRPPAPRPAPQPSAPAPNRSTSSQDGKR